ncbi:MAG: hypothetical protein H9917_02805 [Candidatus Oceanisphaera merdipullorum]|nr:hypothetical protein [Candidatus Oceanisphaera merdipullorum]
MQKRKQSVLKKRKTVWSSRRNILMKKVKRKILRRNHAHFLFMQDHGEPVGAATPA